MKERRIDQGRDLVVDLGLIGIRRREMILMIGTEIRDRNRRRGGIGRKLVEKIHQRI
jgi:hypothetical protein